MNIMECERIAKERGHDSMKFLLITRNGTVYPFRWVDAHAGEFTLDDGSDNPAVASSSVVNQIDEYHKCIIVDDENSVGVLSTNGVEWGNNG